MLDREARNESSNTHNSYLRVLEISVNKILAVANDVYYIHSKSQCEPFCVLGYTKMIKSDKFCIVVHSTYLYAI
jgi:hypothetical protein